MATLAPHEPHGLTAMRRRRGRCTQAAAAEAFGVGLRTWHGWEKGRSRPTIAKLEEIARAWGCTVSELLERPRAPTSDELLEEAAGVVEEALEGLVSRHGLPAVRIAVERVLTRDRGGHRG